MLKKVHEGGHQGIAPEKRRAREVLYWSNMSSQTEDLISRCSICISERPDTQNEPMMNHGISDIP